MSGPQTSDDALAAAQAAQARKQPEQAVAHYRRALEGLAGPRRYAALLGLAGALADASDLLRAEAACREAVALDAAPHPAHAMLASILLDLGKVADAAAAAGQALARAPSDVAMLNLATGAALRLGQTGEALELADRCLIMAPTDQRALAHRAIALAQLGRGAEAARLIDFDRLLRVAQAMPPVGYATIEAFNGALVAALVGRADLNNRHIGVTLIGGARLEDTFALGPPLAEALRALFETAARDYAAALSVEPNHPVALGRPVRFALSSWANIMQGESYELAHMHQGSWLSGVYYPEMPAPDGQDGGAIEFGGHDFGAALPEAGPTRRIMPLPGTLVLFPSYFYHRTIPFAGRGRRISIAFDVKASVGAG